LSEKLEAWLAENGNYPLIQILMHPSVLLLLEKDLVKQGFQLAPIDLGDGEPPTLTALPNGELLASLIKLDVDGGAVQGAAERDDS
jgi:hypothetical protein